MPIGIMGNDDLVLLSCGKLEVSARRKNKALLHVSVLFVHSC